ncbi:unnamed protein product [Amoebophrya sp. A25]|nr:unnamed protein product [Amoebophrya sp. A25]|eukprot:GSA25T00013955001.1
MAPCIVMAKSTPPRRSEGGGFIIADILAGYDYQQTDPFLIWHELPKKYMHRGEFPGAPMHPHRGFSEVPYFKKMGQTTYTRRVSGIDEDGGMGDGDLEWGMAGNGIEHGVTVSPEWEGEMHGFQLWVNLPEANRLDAPDFQNASSKVLPKFEFCQNLSCKVLVGEMKGQKSPVQPRHTDIAYFDFEVQNRGTVMTPLSIPLAQKRRMLYVYEGSLKVISREIKHDLRRHEFPEAGRRRADGAAELTSRSGLSHPAAIPHISNQGASRGETPVQVETGEVVMLSEDGEEVLLTDLSPDCQFLLATGTPLREECVQYGPFVMGDKAAVMQAFQDFQMGRLSKKPATYTRY